MGLEPTQPAWKASALPLDDLRKNYKWWVNLIYTSLMIKVFIVKKKVTKLILMYTSF